MNKRMNSKRSDKQKREANLTISLDYKNLKGGYFN
jgi:hypothetical protein